MMDPCGKIVLGGGEITVNPYKKDLYEEAKNIAREFPEMQFQIYSNCFIYDQEIADLLLRGKNSFLQCDLDAGTPETYIKVKGFNKFDMVCGNLKKYAQYGKVNLKYIVLPDWNDTQADYEGTVKLLKELGSKELTLSLESGLSRNGNRMHIREALYAVARLMVMLEQNGIQALLPNGLWKDEYAAVARRLFRELRTIAGENGK